MAGWVTTVTVRRLSRRILCAQVGRSGPDGTLLSGFRRRNFAASRLSHASTTRIDSGQADKTTDQVPYRLG